MKDRKLLSEEEIEEVFGGQYDRRKANKKKQAPELTVCPECGEPMLPHRVCPNCGYYDAEDVIKD